MKIMTIMKKIFFALVAIFGLWSCVQEELPVVNGNKPVVGEGEVLVEGSIYLPEMQDATRSFTQETISSLHILVFDEKGYLVQQQQLEGTFGVEKDTAYNFSIALGMSALKRSIHLVANTDVIRNEDGELMWDENLPVADVYAPMLGDQMRHVLNQLYTTGGENVFWGEVILPNGITGTKAEGSTTYEPSDEVTNALTRVPMVRNYTRIRLSLDADVKNLTGVEMALMNIPDRGSVVPFIRDGVYAQFSTRNGTNNTEKNYLDIISQNYFGYYTEGTTLLYTDASSDDKLVWIGPSTATEPVWFSCYERLQQSGAAPVANPAYAIIRGKFVEGDITDSDYTYYKIDLCYTDANSKKQILFNLLRNMQYNVTINDVRTRGYSSAAEAARNIATNNISAATETIGFNNVSDGKSRLSVEYVEKVLTKGGAEYTLKYKYEPTIGGDSSNGAVIFSGIYKEDDKSKGVIDGAVITNPSWAESDDSEGWRTFTFTAAEIGSGKQQNIVLSAGNDTDGWLTRDVRYILGDPKEMTLTVSEKVANQAGMPLGATITLPPALYPSMFPLDIYIISENNSLTSSLPLVTGLNNVGAPVSGGEYFGYVVTVEADDYFVYDVMGEVVDYNLDFPVDVKTNRVDAANVHGSGLAGTLVRAYNPYLTCNGDHFWVIDPYGLTLTITSFNESTAVTAFTINSNNLEIEETDWSVDDNGAKYFDFKFSFSNDNVALTDAKVANATTGDDRLQVIDGNTLRIYKDLYDGATNETNDDIRNYTLTFTDNSNAMMGTTITAYNSMFDSVSRKVGVFKLSWDIVNSNNETVVTSLRSGTSYNYRLRITLPAGIPTELLSTLKIKVASSNTNVRLDGANRNNGYEHPVSTSGYDATTGTDIYITLGVSANGYGNATRTFSLTLTGADSFEMPAAISKSYSNNYYR